MKILFLTDSLGYPRVHHSFKDIDLFWPYALRKVLLGKGLNHDLYFDMRPGRDTREIVSNLDYYYKTYNVDLIIIQVGIVDCYPRAIKEIELKILNNIPFVNKITKYIVKKFYSKIIQKRDITYVNKKMFKENCMTIKQNFNKAQIIVIPIGPPNSNYIKINPLIKRNVDLYNNILKEIFVDDCDLGFFNKINPDDIYIEDNHHLSIQGHEYICSRLAKKLTVQF